MASLTGRPSSKQLLSAPTASRLPQASISPASIMEQKYSVGTSQQPSGQALSGQPTVDPQLGGSIGHTPATKPIAMISMGEALKIYEIGKQGYNAFSKGVTMAKEYLSYDGQHSREAHNPTEGHRRHHRRIRDRDKRERDEEAGNSILAGKSSSRPPNTLKIPLHLGIRSFMKWDRTYESGWVTYSPFNIDPSYTGNWATTGSGSDTPCAADGWGSSLFWKWGTTAGGFTAPRMKFGAPLLSNSNYITAESDLLHPGWGQVGMDYFQLAHVLRYWSIPTVEVLIQRIPRVNTTNAGVASPQGVQYGNYDDYGYFSLAPWAGDDAVFSYADGKPLWSDLIGSAPDPITGISGYVSNIQTALDSGAFGYDKRHNRLAPGGVGAQPDFIKMATEPTLPVFVTEDSSAASTILQGYTKAPEIDTYDFLAGVKSFQGFCHKIMWVSPILTDQNALSQAEYRVKFRLRFCGHTPMPFDDFVNLPTEDPETKPAVEQLFNAQMDAAPIIAKSIVQKRVDIAAEAAQKMSQTAQQLLGPGGTQNTPSVNPVKFTPSEPISIPIPTQPEQDEPVVVSEPPTPPPSPTPSQKKMQIPQLSRQVGFGSRMA